MHSDKEIHFLALTMLGNFVETGDPILSANDAAEHMESWLKSKYQFSSDRPPLPKQFTDEQREYIRRIRQLAKEALK